MRRFLALVCVLVCPAVARAQWSWLPNGELGYTTTYTTNGFFTCDPRHVGIVGGTCTTSANQLRFTSGSAVLDLIYHPVTATITASNVTTIAPMGFLETILSGSGAFTFPATAHSPTQPLFFLSVYGFTFGYSSPSLGKTTLMRNCCDGHGTYVIEDFSSPPPSPYSYTKLVFDAFDYPDIDAVDETTALASEVGIIPEPQSYILTATGLVGFALFRRGRRRRRAS